jgi:hypothetical protein
MKMLSIGLGLDIYRIRAVAGIGRACGVGASPTPDHIRKPWVRPAGQFIAAYSHLQLADLLLSEQCAVVLD